jgi:2-succinyl-5-enolpyruvyl-6-hydroxy-3-cyclohexene-1-carboxylate synthase
MTHTAAFSPTLDPDASHRFAAALFDEWVARGVSHVCICPGSRSTALTLAAAEQPGLRCWSHIDERSAGFFALGLAKASRTPVALIFTSGTAAGAVWISRTQSPR